MSARRGLAIGLSLSLASVLGICAPAQAASGDRLWVSRYDGPGHNQDAPAGLAVAPDGSRIYVTGVSNNEATYDDIETVAYDADTGAQAWAATFDGGERRNDFASDLALNPTGTLLFVAGTSHPFDYADDYLVLAYETASGQLSWVRRFGDAVHGHSARSIQVSPDGTSVFVTGVGFRIGHDVDVATVALDSVSGATRWATPLDGPGHGQDIPLDLTLSPDGSRVFIAGETWTQKHDYDWLVTSLDAGTGTPLWRRHIDGPGHGGDVAYSIAPSPDGASVFAVGPVSFPNIGASVTRGFRSDTGELLWEAPFQGPMSKASLALFVTTELHRGLVLVTGETPGPQHADQFTVAAYDPVTGKERWNVQLTQGAGLGGFGLSVAVSPDGTTTYAAGYVSGPNHEDFALVAFDTETGTLLWGRRYDGPGHLYDNAGSVGVDPNGGRVFVTGVSAGVETDYDWASVAYLA